MKKKIKIGFVGFWPNFNPEKSIIYKILSERYEIEFSDNPDYLFCSVFGKPYEYCKYNCVKILVSFENYIPDFNLVDYGISSYPLILGDRHFSMPCFDSPNAIMLENIKREYDKSFLNNKKYFCNFIYSHEAVGGIREKFFNALSEYKRIESAGSYLNNMENSTVFNRKDGIKGGKFEIQRQCKFSICFESVKHEGFITEKIADAFFAESIPIYYGSSNIGQIFNKKAFIDVSDYKKFDEAIEKIKELDNDDDKYLEMLRQPILNDSKYFSKRNEKLKEFLFNIFEQPYEKTFRRSRVYAEKNHNDILLKISDEIKDEDKKNLFIGDYMLVKKENGRIRAFLWKAKNKRRYNQ